MLNFRPLDHFYPENFGEGCCSSCCCDRGKTKSTPSPFDLDWNGLGLEFDKNALLKPRESATELSSLQSFHCTFS